MEYLVTLLEGIISFISPCTLPLLPVYIAYLAGGAEQEAGPDGQAAVHAKWMRPLGFVLGFTAVFCLMGMFAGALGGLVVRYQMWVNIVCGLVVIVFGLSYLGVIPLRFLTGVSQKGDIQSFFSAFLFGIIYAVNLTPCVGAFLGSAIMMAAVSATAFKGTMLLLVYSLGLGIPFLLSALLIEHLGGAFAAIKRHYDVINKVCGVFLLAVGVMMILGLFNRMITFFV